MNLCALIRRCHNFQYESLKELELNEKPSNDRKVTRALSCSSNAEKGVKQKNLAQIALKVRDHSIELSSIYDLQTSVMYHDEIYRRDVKFQM